MSNKKQERPNLPSAQKIAEYWYAYWVEHGNTPWGMLFDEFRLESPVCFACGFFKSEDLQKNAWTSWNKANNNGLQRAHVIAHSLNGSSTVENLVLLCEKCHEMSPDCGDANIMWEWMSSCRASLFNLYWADLHGWMLETVKKADSKYPGGLETLAELKQEKKEQIFKEAENNVGGITTHRNEFSNGTMAALYAEAIRLGWKVYTVKKNSEASVNQE